jgi:hypothetical protein
MELYVFRRACDEELLAFASTPDAATLPCGDSLEAWQLLRELAPGEIPPTRVPVETIREQISLYGFCIVLGEVAEEQGFDHRTEKA